MSPSAYWLQLLAYVSLGICVLIVLGIIVDFLRGNRQKMWIMHLVWPMTALYFGPVAAWLYWRARPFSLKDSAAQEHAHDSNRKEAASPSQIAIAAFHCGAGCALGDILGESGRFFIGGAAMAYVADSEFATMVVTDFLLAYILGVFFQYFTIAPMRKLPFLRGVGASVRADTISILVFQIGMFLWMALVHAVILQSGTKLEPDSVVFWFMMQIAMIVGWAFSYPANAWLLRKGWKERMPAGMEQPAIQERSPLRKIA